MEEISSGTEVVNLVATLLPLVLKWVTGNVMAPVLETDPVSETVTVNV